MTDRLRLVMNLAQANLSQLESNSQFWIEENDPFIRLIDKISIETALLALLVDRVKNIPSDVRDSTHLLLRKLSSIARCERSLVLLMRFPHTAVSLGITHIILSKFGYKDEAFDMAIDQALKSGHVESVERIPFRAMDVEWVKSLIFSEEEENRLNNLLQYTTVTSVAHPIYMNRNDAYAITHALMYATDFGRKSLPLFLT
ncbi:MAG: hypothetical protein AAFN93_24095 [Bacteroidota bacterium]